MMRAATLTARTPSQVSHLGRSISSKSSDSLGLRWFSRTFVNPVAEDAFRLWLFALHRPAYPNSVFFVLCISVCWLVASLAYNGSSHVAAVVSALPAIVLSIVLVVVLRVRIALVERDWQIWNLALVVVAALSGYFVIVLSDLDEALAFAWLAVSAFLGEAMALGIRHCFIAQAVIVATAVIGTVASEDQCDDAHKCTFLYIILLSAVVASLSFAYRNNALYRTMYHLRVRMERDNVHLRDHLERLEAEKGGDTTPTTPDLGSPLERILTILRGWKERRTLEGIDADDLDAILVLLARNANIFAPQFSRVVRENAVDQDTQDWLFYEVAARERGGVRTSGAVSTFGPTVERSIYAPAESSNAALPSLFNSLNEGAHQQIVDMLTNPDRWSFDIFRFVELTSPRPLTAAAVFVFNRQFSKSSICDPVTFRNFVLAVEDGYEDNPFHNRTHATEVTINMLHLLNSSALKGCLTELESFAAFVAAIVHDYAHTGLNNNFQVNTESELAFLYNNKSILENHHVSAALRLTRKASHNICSKMDLPTRIEFRRLVVEMVLATDMALHFDTIGQFKSVFGDGDVDLSDANNRLLLLQMAMKCADIGHPTKIMPLHGRWTHLIAEEFFAQGDKEKELGLHVSPFMDRENQDIGKSQIGFLTFVVLPLFEAWCAYVPEHKGFLAQLSKNKAQWESDASASA